MGRHGSCDCLCQECVPGIARPYLTFYDTSYWYPYPVWHSSPEVPYHVAEVVDESVHDRTTTYAQILYVDNAGHGSKHRRIALKFYDTLTYAPSSTIASETVMVYISDRETTQLGSGGTFGTATQANFYLYLYQGIYALYGTKLIGSALSAAAGIMQAGWHNHRRLRKEGGFHITDFSKLYLHIRSSFNMQSFALREVAGMFGSSTNNLIIEYPYRTLTYTGRWNRLPSTKSIASCLDSNITNLVYLEMASMAAGNKLEVEFPAIPQSTTRGAKHKACIWEVDGGAVGDDMLFYMSLYENTTLIDQRPIRVYSNTNKNVPIGFILSAAQHRSITRLDKFRWRTELKTITSNSGSGRFEVLRVALFSHTGPRVAISQVYLSRECL